MKLKNNKKAMSIAITFLVLFSIAIMVLILFYLNLQKQDAKEKITIFNTLDKVYIESNLLDYYTEKIFKSSGSNFKPSNTKSEFIIEFLSNLNEYKNSEGIYFVPGLKQIEAQINEENILLNSSRLKLKLNINSEKCLLKDGKKIIDIKYTYSKTFEKVFKL